VLGLTKAGHQLADGVDGGLAVVQDGVHLFDDGHFHAVFPSKPERCVHRQHAVGDRAAQADRRFRPRLALTVPEKGWKGFPANFFIPWDLTEYRTRSGVWAPVESTGLLKPEIFAPSRAEGSLS
jgi:hypothetical protein